VAEFRLSARAESDLVEIYQYTESTYGAYQAEAYIAGLERTFDLLAHFPRMGVAIEEIAAGCRRFRFQAHVVFYSEQPGRVIIRAVLHQSRQIRPGLFD
jgi:toxin ParE1/3/4